MTDNREQALAYARANGSKYLDDLKSVLAIPSISTSDEFKPDIRRAAEWMATQLRDLGMDRVQVMPTARHPVVYGEWMGAGKDAPVVMLYGHYDVQPVDPIELWETPPFEPTVRGDYLFARGASDMKGQVLAVLKAVEALVKSGGLPVNVKWLIEGEEEIGSENMDPFVRANADLLKADFCLNTDAGMIDAEHPTITYGLRGLAYFEVWVYGPAGDLHSGLYGGVVHNPAQALAELIAGMHDANGTITLPGFYDRVRKVDPEEHAEMLRLPTTEAAYLEQTGAPALWGEKEFIPAERTGVRPTLEVNGLLSGWTGEGTKTVLPAKAMAKISMRLVPDQTPEEIHQCLLRYMEQNAPKDIRWEVKVLQSSPTALTDRHAPGVQAFGRALEQAWGVKPLYRREGGSIGVVAVLQNVIGVESVLGGFGLPGDNLHAPNERLHLPTWYRGIEALIHFFNNLK
jgi:acetylornithine deacetylase/succinyl-diaminopimelate desuccinylase-like protein